MKTWSAEEICVRAIAAAAVGVQAVLAAVTTVERMTRPLGHDFDEELLDQSSADGSAQGPAERPPEVDHSPDPSGGPPAHPDDAGAEWVGWAVPAICTVLADHYCAYHEDEAMYYCHSADGFANPHATFGDSQAWREHVAPLIAVHLESALAHEFPASK